MNRTDAIAWQTVAGLLRGDLDHGDENTRYEIAAFCALLDQRARDILGDSRADGLPEWDAHLCRVMTDPA